MAKRIKEIRPNPLLTSTVEIRFLSKIKAEEVLNTYYNAFAAEYPKIKDLDIPRQLKQVEPSLRFTADYVLSNEQYSISVGNSAIAFENVGEYKLWENYFPIIQRNLEKIGNLDIVTSIFRVGIRYASLFDNTVGLKNMLNANLFLNYDGFDQGGEQFRFTLTKGDINLTLQIFQNANVKRLEVQKNGLLIDIDAFQSKNLPQKPDKTLVRIIDDLHTQEKLLFEFLMKETYLQSLDVTYQ